MFILGTCCLCCWSQTRTLLWVEHRQNSADTLCWMEGGENHFTRFTNCTFLVLLQGVSWAVVIWMDVMMELCGGGMFYLYYSVHFYVTINYELGICGTEACSNDCHSIIF